MRDNRRRNRNIGTAKQGHGQNNRMKIPWSFYFNTGDFRRYFERLTQYKKFTRLINGHEFIFVVEKTRKDCCHACSVEDMAYMLEHIPAADYGDLHLIVFRQPKRKEDILHPVWGSLYYSYEFEHDYAPAVILEAFPLSGNVRFSRRLTVENRNDLERLQRDGLVFTADRRGYRAPLMQETVRAIQLYHTLPHEFGHYVQYRQILETPGPDLAGMDKDALWTYYNESIPALEKEKFAHAYADRMNAEWREKGIIPFPPRGVVSETVRSRR